MQKVLGFSSANRFVIELSHAIDAISVFGVCPKYNCIIDGLTLTLQKVVKFCLLKEVIFFLLVKNKY